MSPVETVIFDLDGTLTDSFDGIVDAFNHALEVHGRPAQDRGRVRKLIGIPLEGMLSALIPDMDAAAIEAVAGTYREHYITVCGETSPLLPGAQEALDMLSGLRLVCASTKYTPQVEAVLRHQGIAQRFALLVGSEDIPKKPAPDLFLKVMRMSGSAPGATVAVGDMRFDVEAARAAGVLPVAVLTGIGSREDLEDAGARHIFPDLPAAARFILGL